MAPKSDTLAPMEGGLKPPRSPKNPPQALSGRRRSNGQGQIRKPGVEWNNADEVDDGRDDALDVSDDEKDGTKAGEIEKRSPSGGQVVDLLDMARPAKPKGKVFCIMGVILHYLIIIHHAGIAKEFEVVQGSPRVIALPDEPRVPAIKDEDWENIDSEHMDQPKSYSAVVRDDAEDF
jgi:hypothetical protein